MIIGGTGFEIEASVDKAAVSMETGVCVLGRGVHVHVYTPMSLKWADWRHEMLSFCHSYGEFAASLLCVTLRVQYRS